MQNIKRTSVVRAQVCQPHAADPNHVFVYYMLLNSILVNLKKKTSKKYCAGVVLLDKFMISGILDRKL